MFLREKTIGLNKTIKTLIFSDLLLNSAWGLIGPIFAIFLTQQIKGGSLEMIGLIAAIFWLTKSLVQPFVGYFLDLKKGELDDFKVLFFSMFIVNLVPFGYFFSTQIYQIFILEFIRGLGMAFVFPSFMAIFTRHIEKGWEALSWGVNSTLVGISAGIAGGFGGFLAAIFGFKVVFILVGVFGLISTFSLLAIKSEIFKET
ncbi:MAG: MFS transporter [Candidatus Pacearchaeota archaeon]